MTLWLLASATEANDELIPTAATEACPPMSALTTGTVRIDSFPQETWSIGTPEALGVNPEALGRALDYLRSVSGRTGTDELFISRFGQQLWRGPEADRQHKTWSVTKSFVSTLLGVLSDTGQCRAQDLARRYEPSLTTRYPNLTLAHFASMSSGYRALGDEARGNYVHGPSQTPYQPADEVLFDPPGSQFAYWDSAANMYANVLTQCAGERLDALFKRHIADPIGMRAWHWHVFDHHRGLAVVGGAGNHGASMELSAESAARFGLLMLAGGHWQGKRLLDPEWIEQMTQVQASHSMGHKHGPLDGRGHYGYNWWVNGRGVDGERQWPEAPASTFAAMGFNNNALFIVPEWSMVIARLGQDQKDKKIQDTEWSEFFAQLKSALQPPVETNAQPP